MPEHWSGITGSSSELLCAAVCTIGKHLMESSASSSSADVGVGVRQCLVASNGLNSSSHVAQSLHGDATLDVDALQTEVQALRKELVKKQDLMDKLQDRERQLRER